MRGRQTVLNCRSQPFNTYLLLSKCNVVVRWCNQEVGPTVFLCVVADFDVVRQWNCCWAVVSLFNVSDTPRIINKGCASGGVLIISKKCCWGYRIKKMQPWGMTPSYERELPLRSEINNTWVIRLIYGVFLHRSNVWNHKLTVEERKNGTAYCISDVQLMLKWLGNERFKQ